MPRIPNYPSEIIYIDGSNDIKLKALRSELIDKINKASQTSQDIEVSNPIGKVTEKVEAGTAYNELFRNMLSSNTPSPTPTMMQAWFYDGPAPLDEEGN